MSFYNPYMKTPDFGQGGSDIMNQIMMMMMMKKMMGGQPQMSPSQGGGMPGVGAGAGMPPQGGMPPQPMPQGGPPAQAQGGAGGMGMGQIDPQMLQMIMQMLMSRQQPGMPIGR